VGVKGGRDESCAAINVSIREECVLKQGGGGGGRYDAVK